MNAFCLLLIIVLFPYLDLYSTISAVAFRVSGSLAAFFPLFTASPYKRTESVKKKKRDSTFIFFHLNCKYNFS